MDTEFSFWAGPFTFNTTVIPGCASNLSPVDLATNVIVDTVVFTWSIPTSGDASASYDLFSGTTAGNVTTLAGSYLTNTATLNINNYNTLFFWKIVPKNISDLLLDVRNGVLQRNLHQDIVCQLQVVNILLRPTHQQLVKEQLLIQ